MAKKAKKSGSKPKAKPKGYSYTTWKEIPAISCDGCAHSTLNKNGKGEPAMREHVAKKHSSTSKKSEADENVGGKTQTS